MLGFLCNEERGTVYVSMEPTSLIPRSTIGFASRALSVQAVHPYPSAIACHILQEAKTSCYLLVPSYLTRRRA